MGSTHSTVRYGRHRGQVGELWRPTGVSSSNRLPVVVLVHGGYWKTIYTKRFMRVLAADVVRHGWLAWNIEYRRVGRLGGGGWPETFDDVGAALDHVRTLDGVDLDRVVTCGHSAGGQLALWGAARHRLAPGSRASTGGTSALDDRPLHVRAAVSLAGVLDLAEAARLRLGGSAVVRFLGGQPEEYPDRYAIASPRALLPDGVEKLVLHGGADTTVPVAMSESYADAARAAGDTVTYELFEGEGHLSMIDPRSNAWQRTVTFLEDVLG